MPPILLAFGIADLLKESSLLEREDVQVKSFTETGPLFEALAFARPVAVLVNLAAPKAGDLLRSWATARDNAVPLIAISQTAPSDELVQCASRIPGTQLIVGGKRFKTRLLDALAQALGVKPRYHPRQAARPWQVTVAVNNELCEKGRIIDWSRSGARVATRLALEMGQPCSLRFDLADGVLQVKASVRRKANPIDGTQTYGVEFVQLHARDEARIFRHLVGPEQTLRQEVEVVRHHQRTRVPKSLSLTARLRFNSDRQVGYLKVVDLSEGGFLGQAKSYQPPLEVGRTLDIDVMSGATKLHVTVEVTRIEKVPSDDVSFVALRFVNLSSKDAQGLHSLLAQVEQRGLRGAVRRRAS